MQKARVVLREEVFIQGLPDYVKDLLKKDNTITNPKKERQKKALKNYSDKALEKLPPEKQRALKKKANQIKWTLGNVPDEIILWREVRDWIAVPRGYFGEAKKIMDHCGIQVELEDETILPDWRDIKSLTLSGSLFDYQWSAMNDLMARATGVVEAPTGSGKTNLLLSLAATLMTPTIITVHTSELFRQTVDRCKEWLNYEPGTIQGSRKPNIKDITIAMIQTLNKRDFREEGWWDRFGCIIVDECHHAPAETWANVLRRFPCRYKYGTTATAWRKDKMEFLIWKMIGPITAKVRTSTVKAAGKIVLPEVYPVPTNYWFDIEDTSDWTKMISDLVSNEERNWLIRDVVARELDRHRDSKALILTDRIEHTKRLGNLLYGFKPVVLHGELKAAERRENMEQVRAGAKLTIATTHLMGEGIDVPGWDMLFLVTPVAGGPKTVQIVGRVARPAPGKERALLFDFVDEKVQYLKTTWYARKKLYKMKD